MDEQELMQNAAPAIIVDDKGELLRTEELYTKGEE